MSGSMYAPPTASGHYRSGAGGDIADNLATLRSYASGGRASVGRGGEEPPAGAGASQFYSRPRSPLRQPSSSFDNSNSNTAAAAHGGGAWPVSSSASGGGGGGDRGDFYTPAAVGGNGGGGGGGATHRDASHLVPSGFDVSRGRGGMPPPGGAPFVKAPADSGEMSTSMSAGASRHHAAGGSPSVGPSRSGSAAPLPDGYRATQRVARESSVHTAAGAAGGRQPHHHQGELPSATHIATGWPPSRQDTESTPVVGGGSAGHPAASMPPSSSAWPSQPPLDIRAGLEPPPPPPPSQRAVPSSSFNDRPATMGNTLRPASVAAADLQRPAVYGGGASAAREPSSSAFVNTNGGPAAASASASSYGSQRWAPPTAIPEAAPRAGGTWDTGPAASRPSSHPDLSMRSASLYDAPQTGTAGFVREPPPPPPTAANDPRPSWAHGSSAPVAVATTTSAGTAAGRTTAASRGSLFDVPISRQSHSTPAAPPPPSSAFEASSPPPPPMMHERAPPSPTRNAAPAPSTTNSTSAAAAIRQRAAARAAGPLSPATRGGAAPAATSHTNPRSMQQQPPQPTARDTDVRPPPQERLQAMLRECDLDDSLAAIALYLKAQYANTPGEEELPLNTMEADDVLALSQCFHSELLRVVAAARMHDSGTSPVQPTAGGQGGRSSFVSKQDDDNGDTTMQQRPSSPPPPDRPPPANSVAALTPTGGRPPPPPQQQHQHQQQVGGNSAAVSSSMLQQPHQQQQQQQPRHEDQSDKPPVYEDTGAAVSSKENNKPATASAAAAGDDDDGAAVAAPPPRNGATTTMTPAGFAPRQRVTRSRDASPLASRSNSVVNMTVGGGSQRGGGQRDVDSSAAAPVVPRSASVATAATRSGSAMAAGANQPTFSKLRPKVMEGTDLVKYGRNGSPKLRFVRLVYRETTVANGRVIEMPFLCWGKNVKASPSGMLPLVELREVTRGATTPNFKRNSRHEVVGERGEVVPPQQCFTLNFAERPVDFYAPGPEDFDTWYGFMKLVLRRNRELEQEADAAEEAAAERDARVDATSGANREGRQL